ncbi:hypothetical protein B5807_00602 [Epicoccum nigrum]|uniref:Uncharacterized protein n=1 Tax=Epicoccum nigrum TaxID=105696 RepID=A0A1Y2MDS5_EPING|nr:hypothetical protein B5807_00602 [Epicoccum nigrum]
MSSEDDVRSLGIVVLNSGVCLVLLTINSINPVTITRTQDISRLDRLSIPPTKTPTNPSSPIPPWVPNKRKVTRAGTSPPHPRLPLSTYLNTHPPHSTGQSEIRVLKDDAPIERTEYNDREVADSDKQLGTFLYTQTPYLSALLCGAKMPAERDEKEAIDESNILDERTRGAAKEAGTYAEPGDDEGLEAAVEENDGTSAGRQ